MVRVLIADDHPMYREGLRGLLESSAGIEVVGAAADGKVAVEAALTLQPDVVLLDLQMPGCNGIDAARAIREQPNPPAILFLTMFQDDESLLAAMRAGGQGYVLKGADGGEIVRAVQAVAHGEYIFSPGVAGTVMNRILAEPGNTPTALFPELTDRERELLTLIARGLDNRTIARRLFISEKTVRNHVTSILMKIGASTRAEAIVLARDGGLIG
jgi:DNA-binding NarL/FixJ family response regulator